MIELCLQEDQPNTSDITSKNDITAFDNANFSTSSIYLYYQKTHTKCMHFILMNGPRFDGLDDSLLYKHAVLSRQMNSDQTITSGGTSQYPIWDLAGLNYGNIDLILDENYIFRSTANYTTTYTVSFNITWEAHNGSNGVKQAWIAKNGSNNDRLGFQSQAQLANHVQSLSSTATVVLEAYEMFVVAVYQTTGSNLLIDGNSQEKSKIQITQIK